MWYLISLENPDIKHILLTSHPYIIGRKNCDILVEGDAAVSRKHALVELEHPEAHLLNHQKLPTVTLTDLSKFGTTLNGVKLQTNDVRELHDGDMIMFGNTSTFTLVYEPFIISSSCLDQPSKRKVREFLQVLGGHMVNEWKKECSLLVMNNISVTIKVVCALLSLKPIVTPEYMDHYVKHLKGKDEKPNPDLFLPVVTETQVDTNEVSFIVKPERRNIFQGMKFIFLNPKQFKKMHIAVELGGGLPVLLEEKLKNDKMLIEKGSVVMQCDPKNCTQMMSQDSHDWVLHVQSLLRKHKKHMIQDAEIGYAVLYCCTERHCNPDFDVGSQLLNPMSSQSVSHTDVLVENTEMSQKRSPTQIRKKKCETVLDETRLENKNTLTTKAKLKHEALSPEKAMADTKTKRSSKRGRSGDEEIQPMTPIQKKIKQEIVTPAKTEKEKNRQGSEIESRTQPKNENESTIRQTRSSPRSNKTATQQSRSPSPARRSSPRKQRSPSPAPRPQRSSNRQHVKREIVDDSYEETSAPRRKPIVVDDSDDEFGNIGSKGKGKKSLVSSRGSGNDDEFSVVSSKSKPDKNSGKSTLIISDSDEEFHVGRPSKTKHVKNEASPSPRPKSKHTDDDDEFSFIPSKTKSNKNSNTSLNVSESGEEFHVGRPSKTKHVKKETSPSPRSKSKHTDDDGIVDDTERTQTIQSRPRKRKVLVEESDDDIESSRKGKRKHLVENSDDEFDKLMSKKKKAADKPKSDSPAPPSPPKDHDIDGEDGNANGRDVKTEPENPDPRGFVSTSATQQDPKTTEYIKEDDLPSRCINIQFVDLVTRKPRNKPSEVSIKEVPDGFIRWKGKIVRNFKKFKKTMNAGANVLPRIIGGSDLVAHIASNRKDLDDWFKDAINAESQQNETERKAQELFDWEPNKKKSR